MINCLVQKKFGSFCTASCRTIFTNKNRVLNQDTNKNISEGLKKAHAERKLAGYNGFPKRLDRITAPFSRIFINACAHCSVRFTARIKRKFCDDHSSMYHRRERDRFAFTFKFEDYPQLFDIEQIKKIGLFHPKKNPKGLSRDHRVSVNSAIKHMYDPFYIKHPLNCEIMTQSQNSSKKTKNSLSYEELKRLVDEFEKVAPVPGFEPGFGD